MSSTRAAILGIHQSGPVSSAALVADNKVIAGQAQERFSRHKQDRSFPADAIDYCLSHLAGGWNAIDHVAVGWNAGENASIRYRGGFSDWMRYPGEWLASVPNHVLTRAGWEARATTTRFDLKPIPGAVNGRFVDIHFVDHHTAHARFAVSSAAVDECAVLVVDGWSEQKVTSLFHYRCGQLELLKSDIFPNSIGCFYAAMTEYLGYQPFSDEWRVMGMAAYGAPNAFPELDDVITLMADGGYQLDLHSFDFYNFDRGGFLSDSFMKRFGPKRERHDPLDQRHFDFAAAAQRVFERVVRHILLEAYHLTGSDTVCLAGGTALNCLLNAKVTSFTPFKVCHVSFAPDDSGNSIGAALEIANRLSGEVPLGPTTSAIGPEYSDDDIGGLLERYRLKATRHASVGNAVAQMITKGLIVGWFQGRSEFGPRALGQRSILADPAIPKIKKRLNHSIKYREAYRPFAPCVLLEDADRYFTGMPAGGVPFMEKALNFRVDAAQKVAGCVHADGTGRVQTIGVESGHPLVEVLVEKRRMTGHPMVINTSFNLNGEPIVLSPTDAIRTYFSSGLDALALGSFLLEKA